MNNIKKLLALILSVMIVIVMFPLNSFAVSTGVFAGGNGQKASPFLVATKEQLSIVGNNPWSYFKMISDITFTAADFAEGGEFYNNGAGWKPIGGLLATSSFEGYFDGDNHTISGLCINLASASSEYAGLFRDISGGTIMNLNVANFDIRIDNNSYSLAGGIIGYAENSTIVNCNSAGIMTNNYTSIGGIIGAANSCNINDCHNTGSVNGSTIVGGICGYSLSNTFNDCYNTGEITSSNNAAGGIVGGASSSTISKCFNDGNVIGYSGIGGIAGTLNGTISDSYNNGKILPYNSFMSISGGIAGQLSGTSTIATSYNTGEVDNQNGQDLYGSFSGQLTIKYCYYLKQNGKSYSYSPSLLTEEQMKDKSSFYGFNYNGVWEIDDFYGYYYPQLASNRYEKISDIKVLSTPSQGIETVIGKLPNLSGTDGLVQITYSDGKTVIKNISDQMLSKLDLTQLGTQNIALSYGGVLSKELIPITVNEKAITEIKVTKLPDKTQYKVEEQGATLDTSGMVVTAYYDNDTSEEVTGYTVSGFDLSVGEKTITVSYGGKQTTFSVAVKKIDSIGVNTLPTKTEYVLGQKINCDGGKLTLTCSDGTNESVDLKNATLDYDQAAVGTVPVSVDYLGHETSFNITVNPKTVAGISLKAPNKVTYYAGDSLDLSGGQLTVTYESSDNYSETISLDSSMISGYDANKTGLQTLTVSYGGKTATYQVFVQELSLTSIAVTTDSAKTSYVLGQGFDVTGGKITLSYNNGTSKEVDLSTAQLSYDKTATGTVPVTVTYGGQSTSFNITVNPKTVSAISLQTPTKTSYFVGDELSLTGGELTVTYVSDDNYSENISLDTSMISGYDPTKSGEQTVTVSYGGKTASFKVNVQEVVPTGISVKTNPDKTKYLESDTFDSTGLVIVQNYNNGTQEEITGYDLSGYDSSLGSKTITVTYGEFTTTFTVRVTLPGITLSGKIQSHGNNEGETTISLYEKGSDTVAYEQKVKGNEATYSIDGVTAGEYEVRIIKEDNVIKKFDLTVGDQDIIDKDYSIYLLGDVNEDGDIDNMDIKRLQSHIKGNSKLSDNAIGDLNGDGDVDNMDIKRLQAHIKGDSLLHPYR